MKPLARHSSTLVACLLIGGVMLVALLSVAGWRHRHTVRDHAHSASAMHHFASHESGDAAIDRSGWHIHLNVFGIAVTIWEPGTGDDFDSAKTAESNPSVRSDSAGRTVADDGVAVFAAAQSPSGWLSLLCLEPGPLPTRCIPPNADHDGAWDASADDRMSSRIDAPPVPPPECV